MYDPFGSRTIKKPMNMKGRPAGRMARGLPATSAINARPTYNPGSSGLKSSPSLSGGGLKSSPSLSGGSGPSGLAWLDQQNGRKSVAERRKRMAAEHWSSPINPYGKRAKKDMLNEARDDYETSRNIASTKRETAETEAKADLEAVKRRRDGIDLEDDKPRQNPY